MSNCSAKIGDKPNYVYIWPPIMARDVMTHKEFADLDLKGFKTIFSGDVTHPDIQKVYREKGARTCDGYGMTEVVTYMIATPCMYYGEDREAPLGGKVPLEDNGEVKLVDPSTGEEVKTPGERGEVWFKGDRPHVLIPGYYNMPLETSEAIDSEGWFHTKDLGYRDEKGYLYVGGRTDDIINVGAEKLSLIEVEQVLVKHPKIKDCALIGVTHERYSTAPAALIVPTEPIDDREAFKNELDEFMIKNLLRWKRPRLYILVGEIPRIAAKKTKKIGDLKKYVENIILKSDSGIQIMVGEKRK